MRLTNWLQRFGVIVAAVCFWAVLPSIGQTGMTPAAPVPPQIASAQTIFISNGGSDCIGPVQNQIGGGPDLPYNQFYAAMKQWARYQLTSDPAQSDLVFEVHFSCVASAAKLGEYDSQFRVVIYDVKTHFVLWTATQPVEMAILSSTAKKNFAAAANALIDDLKTLAAAGATIKTQ